MNNRHIKPNYISLAAQHTDRNPSPLRHSHQSRHERGAARQPVLHLASRHAHAESAPRFCDSNIASHDATSTKEMYARCGIVTANTSMLLPIFFLQTHNMPTGIQHCHSQWKHIVLRSLLQRCNNQVVRSLQRDRRAECAQLLPPLASCAACTNGKQRRRDAASTQHVHSL